VQRLTTNGTTASAAGYCALEPLTNVESVVTTPRVYSALLSTMAKTIGERRTFAFSNALPVLKICHAIAPRPR
jgi:hypothetical protein